MLHLFNRFFSNLAIEGGGGVEGPAQYVSIVVVWLHVIGSNYKLKSSHFVLIEFVSKFLESIHTSYVFSKLNLRPDIIAKSSNSFNNSFKDFSEPSRNMDVSSAYCEILFFEFPTLTPLIHLLLLILFAKNSAQIINI